MAICETFRVSQSTAYRWINEAFSDKGVPHPKEFALRLDHSRCEHQPIQTGEATVCLTCLKSGYDHLPSFQPKPLPRDPPKKLEDRGDGLKGGV